MIDINKDYIINAFKKFLPDRYTCDSGTIIDSKGNYSYPMDMVIYDSYCYPKLTDKSMHNLILIESVYAIFEIYYKTDANALAFTVKATNIVRNMLREQEEIADAITAPIIKEPIKILSGLISSTSPPTSHWPLSFDKELDCIFCFQYGLIDRFNGKINRSRSPHASIYFLYRLLNKLQLMGPMPAIDLELYAPVLSRLGLQLGVNYNK